MDINQFEKYIASKKKRKNGLDFWDKKAKVFSKAFNNIKDYRDDFLFDFLEDRNILSSKITVADIGCAIGRHSIEFNKKVGKYTGIDSSLGMIKVCNDNKEKYNLSNCNFIQVDWKDYNENFDLVFASMFPGIKTVDDIKRFINLSKEHCLFQRIIKEQDELYLLINGVNKNTAHNNPDYAYGLINIIWKLGYIPEVISSHLVKTKEIEYDKALSLYSSALDSMDQNKKENILKELSSKTNNNIISYTETVTKLIIYFNKKIKL